MINDSSSVKYDINTMLIYLYPVIDDLDAVISDFIKGMSVVEGVEGLIEGR